MARASVKDYEAVEKVLGLYIEGCDKGDSSIMKKAFHDDATVYGANLDGSLLAGHIQKLFDIIDKGGPKDATYTHVDIFAISGATASARVVMEVLNGSIYTDYHHLVKVDGEWKIVSKIYQTHSK